MPDSCSITYKQFIFIIFIVRIAITLTTLPPLPAPPANQDVWISELLAFPIMLLLSTPIYLLWKMFPGMTIIQYSETIIGKWAGKLVGLLYIWLFLHLTAMSMTQFGEFMVTAIMPETPLLFFITSMVILCAYATSKGIEVLGRLSEISAPIIMLAIITVFILLIKDMNIEALKPVMEKGFLITLHGGFTIASRTNELVTFAMLLPFLNEPKKAKTAIVTSGILMSIFWVIITLPILTILGPELAKNQTYPFYRIVRAVSVGNFLERIELVHVSVWLIGIFIKMSYFYFLFVLGISQLFGLKDYKPFVIPAATVIVPLSIIMGPSIVAINEFTNYRTYTWYCLFFLLMIPSLLLIVATIQKLLKKVGTRNEKTNH